MGVEILVIRITRVARFDPENEPAPPVDNLLCQVDDLRHIRDVSRVKLHDSAQVLVRLQLIRPNVKQVNRAQNLLNHSQIGKGTVREGFKPLTEQAASPVVEEHLRDGGPAKLPRHFFDE